MPVAASSSCVAGREKRRSAARSSVKAAGQPQAMQSQPRRPAREQHDAQVRGRIGQEALERRQRVVRLQLVQIVDDQQGRLVDPLQRPQQPLDQRFAARLASPLTGPASPSAIPSSASITEAQKRCPSRSSCATVVHAVRCARPASATQERSSQVFPLPAGADTIVTRPARGEPLEEVAPRDQRLVAAARARSRRPREAASAPGNSGTTSAPPPATIGRDPASRIRRRCEMGFVLAFAREARSCGRVAGRGGSQ